MPDFTCIAPYIVVIMFLLFLPLTALTYYFFRRGRREAEVQRIFKVLDIDPEYKKAFDHDAKQRGRYMVLAVGYAVMISIAGLSLLFLGGRMKLDEFPTILIGTVQFPQSGSRFIFSMAFLGAYLWGLQHVLRRYSMNDLTPGVYYTLSIRMILAAVIALLIFNAYNAIADRSATVEGITTSIWPVLAFLIGMFPQRGLHWLTDRLSIFSSKSHSTVSERPLEMIEGMTIHDRLRLDELGIDNCFDLANTDFVPLMINTPYGARELLDWILQAKLCVHFGEAVKDLRLHSIRTIIDLGSFDEEDIGKIAETSAATKSALLQASQYAKNDPDIQRLRAIVHKLGHFTAIEENEAEPG